MPRGSTTSAFRRRRARRRSAAARAAAPRSEARYSRSASRIAAQLTGRVLEAGLERRALPPVPLVLDDRHLGGPLPRREQLACPVRRPVVDDHELARVDGELGGEGVVDRAPRRVASSLNTGMRIESVSEHPRHRIRYRQLAPGDLTVDGPWRRAEPELPTGLASVADSGSTAQSAARRPASARVSAYDDSVVDVRISDVDERSNPGVSRDADRRAVRA